MAGFVWTRSPSRAGGDRVGLEPEHPDRRGMHPRRRVTSRSAPLVVEHQHRRTAGVRPEDHAERTGFPLPAMR